MNKLEVTVNEATWTEKSDRRALKCKGCQLLTKGRLGKEPWCMDCGMERLMKPLASVKDILQGLFK